MPCFVAFHDSRWHAKRNRQLLGCWAERLPSSDPTCGRAHAEAKDCNHKYTLQISSRRLFLKENLLTTAAQPHCAE